MHTQALSAPQSRKTSYGRSAFAENLTLEQTSFKSAFKSQVRRQWQRLNILLRSWSRNTTAKHGTALLWLTAVASVAGLFAAIAEHPRLTAIFAMIALASMAPELTKLSYDKMEDEI